jgi:succinyl-CoA synthetase alpha subunit
MREHLRTLAEDVKHRVTALAAAVNSGISHEPSVAELLTYLAEQVLPHAAAEELSIYCTAAAQADLANTVNEMIAEHRVLVAAVESLANAPTAATALTQATQIATFFTTHVNKENELLLPALHEDSGGVLIGTDNVKTRARWELHVGDAYVPIYPFGLEKSLEAAGFTETTLGAAPSASSSLRRQDRDYPLRVASLR